MQVPPPIEYAEREGGRIAYQQAGDGDQPASLVTITDPPSHLDLV